MGGWDFLQPLAQGVGTAFGGPLGGAVGGAIGGFLSNRSQSQGADQATLARQTGILNQMNALNGGVNAAVGFQQGQFGNNLGLQNSYLGQGAGQGDQQLAMQNGLFSPYTQAGAGALGGLNQYAQGGLQAFQQQQALSGGLGAAAQQQALSGLSGSPLFQQLARSQEDAILQNASATGGLRGGNVQMALADSRAGLLNQLQQQQFNNLGGLAALGASGFNQLAGYGQQSAGQQAQGGLGVLGNNNQLLGQIATNVGNSSNQFMNSSGGYLDDYGVNMSNLFGQQGMAAGANAEAQGLYDARNMANFGNVLGTGLQAFGPKMGGLFGGTAPAGRPFGPSPGNTGRWW